jgi:RimJ/RimL family protein N-acetyltransferase
MQKEITSKTGKKLVMKPPEVSDAPALLAFICELVDEDVMILLNEKPDLAKEEKVLKDWLEKIAKKEKLKYLIMDGDKCVASADIDVEPYRHKHIGDFGIAILKDYRGLGLGKILMEELIKESKEVLGLKMLELQVYSTNQTAKKLYEKMGFVEYGTLPEAVLYQGEYIDRVHMYRKLDV